MTSRQFPVRLHGHEALVAIRLPHPMGGSAKLYLREVAKAQLPELYHQPIVTGIAGRTDSGQEIPINSVGRWLFGVPGYMGHIRVDNWEGTDCKVEFPRDSPDVIFALINRLKAVIEGEAGAATAQHGATPSGGRRQSRMDHDAALTQARELVDAQRPEASVQKRAAFANSVATLVTGWSGGFGGPSVREHAASRMHGGMQHSFKEAVDLLLNESGPIFGPLNKVHEECWEEEFCFDDDPSDVVELVARTGYQQ